MGDRSEKCRRRKIVRIGIIRYVGVWKEKTERL